MRRITLTAMTGVITLALGGAALAHGGVGGGFHGGGAGGGFHGGGGFHASAFHGGGFHRDRGGFHGGEAHASMHSHDSHGHQSAMNDRSNRGGLRRGEERASYVHGLNSERRGDHTGTTATAGTGTTRTGGM